MEFFFVVNFIGCVCFEFKMSVYVKRFVLRFYILNSISILKLFQSIVIGELNVFYSKQFVYFKFLQYWKMKIEWKFNVYLVWFWIQGLGLYVVRDIEKYIMVIEYIGIII